MMMKTGLQKLKLNIMSCLSLDCIKQHCQSFNKLFLNRSSISEYTMILLKIYFFSQVRANLCNSNLNTMLANLLHIAWSQEDQFPYLERKCSKL